MQSFQLTRQLYLWYLDRWELILHWLNLESCLLLCNKFILVRKGCISRENSEKYVLRQWPTTQHLHGKVFHGFSDKNSFNVFSNQGNLLFLFRRTKTFGRCVVISNFLTFCLSELLKVITVGISLYLRLCLKVCQVECQREIVNLRFTWSAYWSFSIALHAGHTNQAQIWELCNRYLPKISKIIRYSVQHWGIQRREVSLAQTYELSEKLDTMLGLTSLEAETKNARHVV